MKIALVNYIGGGGKDTVADMIEGTLNKIGEVERIRLSDGIYEICDKYFGYSDEKPPRGMLHHVGESMRQLDSNVWINNAIKHSKESEKEGKHVIITDVRKKIEFDALKENGFVFIMVKTSFFKAIMRCGERGDNLSDDDIYRMVTSELEKEMRDYESEMDFVIENNSTIVSLEEKVASILKALNMV